jgi:hypothetical protein
MSLVVLFAIQCLSALFVWTAGMMIMNNNTKNNTSTKQIDGFQDGSVIGFEKRAKYDESFAASVLQNH